MAYQELKFKVIGVRPLIMSSSRLSDPLDDIAREIAKIKAKRKKTDSDYERISYLEFIGGLWVTDMGLPCIPSYAMEQCFIEGAKRQRMGKHAKAGFEIWDNGLLEYDGPKDSEALWQDKKYVLRIMIKTSSGGRTPNTKAIFHSWGTNFICRYLDEIFNQSDIAMILKDAGNYVGLGSGRPKAGKFRIELID